MISLFENFGEKEIDLTNSLLESKIVDSIIVLNDNGFLPDNVTSPIDFFTGRKNKDQGKYGRFFNDIAIPFYWEIKGDGQKADIYDGYLKKGHIEYSDRYEDYRIVKTVSWFDDNGIVVQKDLYNKNGEIFGKQTFSDSILINTTFFDQKMTEIISINSQLGVVELTWNNKNYIFESYINFIEFYFINANIDLSHIIYNSLSKPLFIVSRIEHNDDLQNKGNILFWQEKSDKMPWNMLSMINDEASLTKKIIVQDREEFIRLQSQIPDNSKKAFMYLGNVYKYKQKPVIGKNIFILTNSDNIANLEYLSNALMDYNFIIAARTNMSSKLINFGSKNNIKLYPSVTEKELLDIMDISNIYLDINYGNEVEGIVRKAFNNNKLIFGFNDTVHNSKFIDEKNVFGNDSDKLELIVQKILNDTKDELHFKKAISGQQWFAGSSSVDDYKEGVLFYE